jgi:hypothetical protein
LAAFAGGAKDDSREEGIFSDGVKPLAHLQRWVIFSNLSTEQVEVGREKISDTSRSARPLSVLLSLNLAWAAATKRQKRACLLRIPTFKWRLFAAGHSIDFIALS